jgi:predicted ribosome quality control (RQC) complex YloA/Tae2 family protein
MDIKKPTEAELTAWLKDNGFDHDLPATSIGDLLKEYMNKVETPADYVFDPKTPIKPRREPTVHNIDLTKKTPEDYWRKLALDFRADRDRLQKQVDESGASYRRTIDRMQTVINEKTDLIADMKRAINEKTDLIARLRGCLDKERDAYAGLAKRLDRMREAYPRAMESIEYAIDRDK